jgi:hypothetical protein
MSDDNDVLDVSLIEDNSLDLLSPVSLSTIVERATPKKTKVVKSGLRGLLDAFGDEDPVEEMLL